jgi:hypothetical protein
MKYKGKEHCQTYSMKQILHYENEQGHNNNKKL